MISRTFVTRTPQVRRVQRPTLNPTFRTTYMCSCWPTPSTAPDPPPCLLWAQPTSTTTRKPRTLLFIQVDNTKCKGSLNFMMELNCNIFQFKNTCNVFPTDDGIFVLCIQDSYMQQPLWAWRRDTCLVRRHCLFTQILIK